MDVTDAIIIRNPGLMPYAPVFSAMQAFTASRTSDTPDEIWLLEHEPVFTLGLGADRAHLLDTRQIPVVQTDRGGEVTYHAPGQAVVYLLIDIRRRAKNQLLVKEFVRQIEGAMIETLRAWQLHSERREGAPGIYLVPDAANGAWQGAKIGALGLRVLGNGCIYHGLSLNVAMDLAPFSWINPCGYAGMQTVDMATMGVDVPVAQVQYALVESLCRRMQARADFSGGNSLSLPASQE